MAESSPILTNNGYRWALSHKGRTVYISASELFPGSYYVFEYGGSSNGRITGFLAAQAKALEMLSE